MVEEKTATKRSKPKFFRKDWHKMIKLGSKIKKKRKWKSAYGRHNKIRLSKAGHSLKPKVGWMNNKKLKGLVENFNIVRVENIKQVEEIKSGSKDVAIIIGRVGGKKKMEIIKKANELKIKILNKYKPEKKESKEEEK